MKIIKQFLVFLVEVFFKVYFALFGKPKINKNLQKTIDLYDEGGFSSLFKLIRAWDAPYEEIEKVVPKSGQILDLGCGDGLLANYLAMSSQKRKILGIELNKGRLKNSDKKLKNVAFRSGDILKSKIQKSDAILLIHVFHHLSSYDDQVKMLKACKENLGRGGKLIVAEIVYTPVLKFAFTSLVDMFALPIIFNNSLTDFNINYRGDRAWKDLFKQNGFKVKTTYPHSGKPFSHALYECTIS